MNYVPILLRISLYVPTSKCARVPALYRQVPEIQTRKERNAYLILTSFSLNQPYFTSCAYPVPAAVADEGRVPPGDDDHLGI